MKKIILKSPYFSIVLLAAIFIAVAAYSLWIPKTVNGLDLLGAIFLFMMAFKAIQMCSEKYDDRAEKVKHSNEEWRKLSFKAKIKASGKPMKWFSIMPVLIGLYIAIVILVDYLISKIILHMPLNNDIVVNYLADGIMFYSIKSLFLYMITGILYLSALIRYYRLKCNAIKLMLLNFALLVLIDWHITAFIKEMLGFFEVVNPFDIIVKNMMLLAAGLTLITLIAYVLSVIYFYKRKHLFLG